MSDERLIVTPDDLFSEEDRDIPNMRMSREQLELTFVPKPGGQWLVIRPTRSDGRAVSFCDLARIGVTLAHLEEIKYPQYRKKKDGTPMEGGAKVFRFFRDLHAFWRGEHPSFRKVLELHQIPIRPEWPKKDAA